MAGLISLMHQMQQSELQNSSSLLTIHNSNSNSKIWKEMLIRSFDNWNFEVMQTLNVPIIWEFQCIVYPTVMLPSYILLDTNNWTTRNKPL